MQFSLEHLKNISVSPDELNFNFKKLSVIELDSGYISLTAFDFYSLPNPIFPKNFLPLSNSLWMSFLYSENLRRTAISYCENFHKIFSEEQIRFGNIFARAGSEKGERFMTKKWCRQVDIYTISVRDSYMLFSRLPRTNL